MLNGAGSKSIHTIVRESPGSKVGFSSQNIPESSVAEARARHSRGISGGKPLYEFATAGLEAALNSQVKVLDAGCGCGHFGRFLLERFSVCPDGMDVVEHDGFDRAAYASFTRADLNLFNGDSPNERYDIVFAIGLLEYIENPRRLVRALGKVLRSGGLLVFTSPNPASLRNVTGLLLRGEFSAFRECSNPASVTPLLACDALRMVKEAGFSESEFRYSGQGRVPGMRRLRWQTVLPGARGRWFSDDFRIGARWKG